MNPQISYCGLRGSSTFSTASFPEYHPAARASSPPHLRRGVPVAAAPRPRYTLLFVSATAERVKPSSSSTLRNAPLPHRWGRSSPSGRLRKEALSTVLGGGHKSGEHFPSPAPSIFINTLRGSKPRAFSVAGARHSHTQTGFLRKQGVPRHPRLIQEGPRRVAPGGGYRKMGCAWTY